VDGTINATCDALSGPIFPIGNTRVVCEATDKSGNKGSASISDDNTRFNSAGDYDSRL
jgi:hypothetical protein